MITIHAALIDINVWRKILVTILGDKLAWDGMGIYSMIH